MPLQLIAENYCGELRNTYGPFDYTNPENKNFICG